MLLVYGPRSPTYDFGPGHPLTPRRFGPGLDLLRAVGAEPGLAPEPAPDDELLWCHTAGYIETVKRFSADPFGFPAAGIGEGGDDPPFAGMHEAGAAVAGGSLRAMEAVLRGDVEHAFHPGGGLHHAMPDRASGFCIYDDPALAIARARRDGLRVLYVDLDVHHGDGVQAIHAADPGVLTLSFHETGRYLFPGTGGVGELGEGAAAGTSVNVPLEPGTGEGAWLAAVRTLLPELAAAFGPDVIVSQHGADSHAWDPLAHLLVTTTAMGEAARLVDRVAHGSAGGRWLATGGGGYDAYRVVPRSWSLVWLAGRTSCGARCRHRSRGGSAGRPRAPATGRRRSPRHSRTPRTRGSTWIRPRSRQSAARSRRWPSFDGWPCHDSCRWRATGAGGIRWRTRDREAAAAARTASGAGEPTIVGAIEAATWDRLTLASRVVPPTDPAAGHALILAAIRDGATVSAAIDGSVVVGLAIAGPADDRGGREVLAVGVAPAYRQRGLAGALLAALSGDAERALHADITLAERDPIEPVERALRASIARRLFEGAGFEIRPADDDVRRADSAAFRAARPPGRG